VREGGGRARIFPYACLVIEPVDPNASQHIPEELLGRIAERLKALADPMRLAILHSLEDGERCVGDIVERVQTSQANVSKHLSVLRHAGLVRARRAGMNVYYTIGDPVVFSICRLVCDSLERQVSEAVADLELGSVSYLERRS
jgi:DNA-binding transcriptional ArsR family regulator